VVSVLAFHSDDLSSNPAEAQTCEFVVYKNENKQKEARFCPLFFSKTMDKNIFIPTALISFAHIT